MKTFKEEIFPPVAILWLALGAMLGIVFGSI